MVDFSAVESLNAKLDMINAKLDKLLQVSLGARKNFDSMSGECENDRTGRRRTRAVKSNVRDWLLTLGDLHINGF